MNIVPLGDCALVVRLRDQIQPANETLEAVLRATQILRDARLPGIIEVAPAFTSVGVYYDAAMVAAETGSESPSEWLTNAMVERLRNMKRIRASRLPVRTIEIPVCYESEFGPDLTVVAEHAGLAEFEVVRRHSEAEYRVHSVGFTPGFPYLSGLPAELATPRRATPRKQVPAGAVAIGGEHTGIYPQASPGGWNIIGRTPRRLFHWGDEAPAVLAAGDRVAIGVISRAEFETLSRGAL